MAAVSPGKLWFQKHLEYHCGDCGSVKNFRSRPRTFSERYLLPVFLLQPVRCAECFRRDYHLVFMPVGERLAEVKHELKPKMPVSVRHSDRNVA